jgi:hypothetical protein
MHGPMAGTFRLRAMQLAITPSIACTYSRVFFVNTHVVTRMTYNFYKLGREGAGSRKGGGDSRKMLSQSWKSARTCGSC